MKILVWGTGAEFWQIYNTLQLNEAMGNFEIVGYVSKDSDGKKIDNKEVWCPEDIVKKDIEFDYILVSTNNYYKEISDYGSKKLQIDRRKFINGKVLKIPHFDWNKYIKIYNSDISVVSETCIGGCISNKLGLPFNSPFVNVRVGIEKNDYFELLNKLDDYMRQTPAESSKTNTYDRNWNGWECRIDFPRLWYDDILIHGFHFQSQKEFLDIWEKRRQRYNFQNKVVLKILYDEEDLEKFIQLEYSKKIGFYSGYTDAKDVISFPNFVNSHMCDRYSYSFGTFLHEGYINSGNIFNDIDIFSILSGDR